MLSSSLRPRPRTACLFTLSLSSLSLGLIVAAGCSSSSSDSGGGGGTPALQNGFSGALDEGQETPAPISGSRVRVTITNNAPQLGTFQTPVWVGFHDGSFDVYDLGAAASAALEPLAEDGNNTPLSDAFSASATGSDQGVLAGELFPGPIQPGETVSMVFELDGSAASSRYFSYASMLIPSNDAFVANGGPMDHEVFDAGGSFVAADFTVLGSAVNDAGTEVNDELPANTAFFGQATPNTGVDEGGVIALHAGFMAPGMGGILDDAMFANADFLNTPGYETLSITFEQLPATLASAGAAGVELTTGDSVVDFTVSATGLSGPATGVHFHQGALGVAGPVLLSLTDSIVENTGGNLLVQGSLATTEAFRTALRAGEVYVNVHTALNLPGELRGQITTDAAFLGTLETTQSVPAPTLGTGVRVTVRNAAPAAGTFQTPLWIGFHDGSFDAYDIGSPAIMNFPTTNALERIAEDGDTGPITTAFDTSIAGTVQGVLAGQLFPGPLQPGETVSQVFRVDPLAGSSRYLTYVSMVIPSNDAFVANAGPMDHEIFDAGGLFSGVGFQVTGAEVLDVGTEVDDEIPANTAFFGQTVADTGTDEMDNVALHPGLLAMGMGGILDDAMFSAADFTAPGYTCLDVDLSEVAATPPTGLVAATLNGSATLISFNISARNLSGEVTGMHFHEAPAGMTGPVRVDLTATIDVNADGVLFASGSAAIDPAFVAALRAGEVYLNLHTDLNPSGEVRAQVLLVE